jgi:two-component system OmpR family sensor kinase
MRTIRGRLAASYAVALAGTMFVFGLVIYLVQRRENLGELDDRARLEANLIAATLGEAYRARGELVVTDRRTGRPVLASEVSPFLEGVPGFVVLVGPDGDVLHLSAEARALQYDRLLLLLNPVFRADSAPAVGIADLGAQAGPVHYYARPVSEAGEQVAAVLAGVSAAGVVVAPQRLAYVMLAVSPVILLASALIGYLLVGRTLKPVDGIVDEVEAISDGRSLHKRLASLETGDELARLSRTLNEMLARLERSFQTLRRFTADASHELKTPLTVLRSGIERAITHPRVTPEVMEILDETLAEVNRMAEMVDALLMLARADEGRAPLHLETIDLRELLTEVSETASLLGEQAAVDVSVGVPDKAVLLAADRTRMRQLLMNLLTNAIKYTPSGGTVAITCEVREREVAVSVRDTGIGIGPGDVPHIFDRFWRADPARSRTGERSGVGLGLAISKWIAEAHGGTITVESRLGRGTTFVVTLPLEAPVPAASDGP